MPWQSPTTAFTSHWGHGMDVHTRIAQLLDWIDDAKAVPFSTSVMVNRDAFADELEAVRDDLPAELRESRLIIRERDEVLATAEREAARIQAAAQAERQRLVAETDVYAEAERQAEQIVADARTEARNLRDEADDYIDAKLAGFEIVLHKTLQTVERGRARLADRLGAGTSPGSLPLDEAEAARESSAEPPPDSRGALYDHEAL